MADSESEAGTVQDGFETSWHLESKEATRGEESCQGLRRQAWSGSLWPKVGQFEHQ